MRKLAVILAIVLALLVATFNQKHLHSSDAYLRARIVKLVNAEGSSCTGVEVKSPKGNVYTLTAAHCKLLLDSNNQMLAIDEDGMPHVISFIAEDNNADLLILTAMGSKSVTVASSIEDHEQVKAITHGHGFKAFRTDGELVQEEIIGFNTGIIATQAQLDDCLAHAPKSVVADGVDMFTGSAYKICMIQTTEVIATPFIMPGSSGGPLFNAQGQLVGIASATSNSDPFGRFVRLVDIQAFLKDM